MRDTKFNKAQAVRYLIVTFGAAYALHAAAAFIWNGGNIFAGQLIVALSMFAPALGVKLSGAGFRGMGWKPRIRKNIKAFLIAWFAPIVLTAAGAGLYFLIFPGHFDLGGGYFTMTAGAEALGMMEAQGISYPMYVLISAAGAVTYAPVINTFLALGEEIGWRGFLYPFFKARFGRRRGLLLGGAVWGAWHWLLIWLIGYEYGAAAGNSAGYLGFPVTGMLLFIVIAAGWGILHDRLYEKSGTIWLPAVFHGAINAAATLPLTVCLANTGSARLLGPAPMGLLAGVPFLIAAAVVLRRE